MPRPNKPVTPPYSSATGMSALIDAVSHTDHSFLPAVPQDLNETGVNESVIEELILKTIYSRGELIGRDVALSSNSRLYCFWPGEAPKLGERKHAKIPLCVLSAS